MPERSKRTNIKHPPQLIIGFPDGALLFDPNWSTRVVSFNGVATLESADHTCYKFKPGDVVPPGLLFEPAKAEQLKPAKVNKRQRTHFTWAHMFEQLKVKAVKI